MVHPLSIVSMHAVRIHAWHVTITRVLCPVHEYRLFLTQLGVREYVCSLERSVILCLAELGVEGFTTDNVGVWVREGGEDRKVCALGKHGAYCTYVSCYQ